MANHPNRSKTTGPDANPTPEDIIDLRTRYGLTQTEAAEIWMASLGAVQKWEAPIGTQNNRRVHPLMWWAMQEILKNKYHQL